MLRILKAGLETTVQDSPGRIGLRNCGISAAGPADGRSFLIGNALLGNSSEAAGLEIQFSGPEILFEAEIVFSITGADNKPLLNGVPIPLWSVLTARSGDILSFGFPEYGCRTYLCLGGGIDVPIIMESRSTHVPTGLGGYQGRALRAGDQLSVCPISFSPSPLSAELPKFSHDWVVDVLLGPFDDCLTSGDIARFFSSIWKVSAKSNRIGYRLEGGRFEFSPAAHNKPPENGPHPSNVLDYGVPVGAINICGNTPVVLLHDGPASTGYITPFTVDAGELWKVGQARPGDRMQFRYL